MSARLGFSLPLVSTTFLHDRWVGESIKGSFRVIWFIFAFFLSLFSFEHRFS